MVLNLAWPTWRYPIHIFSSSEDPDVVQPKVHDVIFWPSSIGATVYYIYTAISEHQPVYPIEDRWAIALNLIQHVVQFWRPLCSVIWLPGSGLSWQPSGLLAWWYMATGSPPIPRFKHPWKRKSHLSLLPIIISIPIFHADLTIPGTSGCFSRSIPFSKMAQRIISAADCQIYCDICKYTSGNAHFDSLIDACNKINVSKKNVSSYVQAIHKWCHFGMPMS